MRALTPEEVSGTWVNKFHFVEGNEEKGIPGLRTPQIGALYALMAHFAEDSGQRAIVVMPTGTGKTETMMSLLVAKHCARVLVIVPSNALRSQTAEKFCHLGILPEIGVVDKDIKLPIVKKIDKGLSDEKWIECIDNTNVIVTTMPLIAKVNDNVRSYMSQKISFLFVDEAHHSEALTWSKFIDIFPASKTVLFTATPFRNDGQKLKGRIVFNFSLRKAQEQGYYQSIRNLCIHRYNQDDADKAIATTAVAQLRKDLENGYNHILMARCKSKTRAEQVFQYYKDYKDLNPILIHSSTANSKEILKSIKNLEHRIVVCVNMLGEGYDLPQLKIAAIHDERQSLAVTLQFIGRFTRTKDNSLGQATFVTNIAYPPIDTEIRQLYQHDADWNLILPMISENATNRERSLDDVIKEFSGSLQEEISLKDFRPRLSARLYTTKSTTTHFHEWKKFLPRANSLAYVKESISPDTLLIVLQKQQMVDWGDVKSIANISWDMILIYFDAVHSRVYVNSTIDLSKNFLQGLFEDISTINEEIVYRVFADIDRLELYSVGARMHLGKDISFQSYYGKSVANGLDELTQGHLLKNNIYGMGYRNGEQVTLGCANKGKVWSRERGDLAEFKEWCNRIGSLVFNENIATDIVLKNTLKYEQIGHIPDVMPIGVDWANMEFACAGYLFINRTPVPIDECELVISDKSIPGDSLIFDLIYDKNTFEFSLRLTKDNKSYDYNIIMTNNKDRLMISEDKTLEEYFNEYPPVIFLADNSMLYGCNLCRPKQNSEPIPEQYIDTYDWTAIDIGVESMKSNPVIENSIQYYVYRQIENLYDYIIDDDDSGEVADLVCIKDSEHTIDITLYHLKYAHGGKVSNRISNLYEVCGQANKSVRWKYDKGRKLFDHFLSRNEKRLSQGKGSRILKGDVTDIIKLREEAQYRKAITFHVVIVQPGMSKKGATDNMKTLLGSTYMYLKQVANIDLHVICSS